MKAARALLVVVTLSLAWPALAHAGTLDRRIERLVAHSGFRGPASSVAVYDLTAGRLLAGHAGRRPMLPASNVKLATSVALLARMGGGARMHTQILGTGELRGSRLHGRLWLVGDGDPSLSTRRYAHDALNGHASRMSRLAAAVRAAGIRRVSGSLVADASLFDGLRTAPGWRPTYWNDSPPLSALWLDEDWLGVGAARSYARPARHAARVLRGMLARRGVLVRRPEVGVVPPGAFFVASLPSPPLRLLLRHMNHVSDNAYAEVLVKRLAVAAGERGTTAHGVAVVRQELREVGVPLRGLRLRDGSGLSTRDRMSARQLVALLRGARARPFGRALLRSLPVAGRSGTLEDRMRRGPASGNARAKTGTLDDASALSGYVRTRNGHRLAFSILQNRPALDIAAAHALQDRVVELLARSRPR